MGQQVAQEREIAVVVAMALAGIGNAGLSGTAYAAESSARAVYTSPNAPAGNEVVVYERHDDADCGTRQGPAGD